MSLNRRMSDAHEQYLAESIEGRIMPGSGNQAAKPMDVRQSRYERRFAWAVDGKSTRAKSVSVTLGMLHKAVEQAHSERPAVALRFYGDDRLRGYEDWMVIRMDDFLELIEAAEGDS